MKLQLVAHKLHWANKALLKLQIESQAVDMARMLEQFEGSVAALREIERQYSTLQVALQPRSLQLQALFSPQHLS